VLRVAKILTDFLDQFGGEPNITIGTKPNRDGRVSRQIPA
jgi:hypothetical protein